MQQPIIEIQDLKVNVKDKTVLAIGNFVIHRGIIYTVTGQMGAGKSTLLEVLAGVRRATGGIVSYDGIPSSSAEFRTKLREEVCFLPQLPRKARGTVLKYLRKEINMAEWSTDSLEDRIAGISKQMSLGEKMDRRVKTLSPGERRWVDLAIALASDSKVLLIDELEQHMSYDELDFLKRQLQRKCNYEGSTVIMSTLNPMAFRRLTGVSVTLDRGHIAMIRSVRDGGRSRRPPGAGNGGGNTPADKPGRRRRPSSRGGPGRPSRSGPPR